MSINSLLKAALEPIVPTEADTYEGKQGTYITFDYQSIPDDWGDDEPGCERFLIPVHLFAPTGADTVQTRRTIKRVLVAAGTTWPSMVNASDKDGQHLVLECEIVQATGVE